MSGDEREAAIRSLLPAVRRIARRIKQLVPSVETDDLVGDGCIGLIRAVDSFDPDRGTTLGHYARRLILGTMLNGVRRMDPVPERSRRTVREAERDRYARALECDGIPTPNEMERLRPGYLRACTAVKRSVPLSLDAPLPEGENEAIDWSGDPARVFERRDDRRALLAAIDTLTQRQRSVVMLHYYGESSMRAIGIRLAISSQRASQLHVAAIGKLQESAFAASR